MNQKRPLTDFERNLIVLFVFSSHFKALLQGHSYCSINVAKSQYAGKTNNYILKAATLKTTQTVV